jgi:hypothetical protein
MSKSSRRHKTERRRMTGAVLKRADAANFLGGIFFQRSKGNQVKKRKRKLKGMT